MNKLTNLAWLKNWKLWMGLAVGALFLYLAFRKVDFGQMWDSLRKANYWYLPPALFVIFLSHYLRALRWRFFLDPVRRVDTSTLFSSLLIGYGANAVTPAHLGEFLRAYVLSRKRDVSMGSVFATIVIERIVDVFSLLALMLLVIFIHPFPSWVVSSGYIMLAATLGLFFFMVFLKKSASTADSVLHVFLKPLPERFRVKTKGLIERFRAGIVPLRRWHDYVAVFILSAAIWACYGLVYYLGLLAFGFISTYHLAWYASLVLLVITTISVVVPSSPGYVGPYHYLCQVSLAMFGVPLGPALSYATVLHAINILPLLVVGLLLASYEGLRIFGVEITAETSEVA